MMPNPARIVALVMLAMAVTAGSPAVAATTPKTAAVIAANKAAQDVKNAAIIAASNPVPPRPTLVPCPECDGAGVPPDAIDSEEKCGRCDGDRIIREDELTPEERKAQAARQVSSKVTVTFRSYPDRTVTTVAGMGCVSTLTVWKTLYPKARPPVRTYSCLGKP